MLRWPDGNTSSVGAPSKDEAMLFADGAREDPYDAEITELKRVAMDFIPAIEESHLFFEVSVCAFGGDERYDWSRKAYPLIEECRVDDDNDDPTHTEMLQLLEQEKERVKEP